MTNAKTIGKRAKIKQIISRDSNWDNPCRVSTYVRHAARAIGRPVSRAEVIRSLTHMEQEGQLIFAVTENDRVIGKVFDN